MVNDESLSSKLQNCVQAGGGVSVGVTLIVGYEL